MYPEQTPALSPRRPRRAWRSTRSDGVPVRITGVARTVADCFKYRNKIGLDVALEALKEGLGTTGETRRTTVDDLWRYAQLGRVANVMRPYLESLT